MKKDSKCAKMGWFGVVMGHPKRLKLAPFDRAHTSSYVSL